MKRLFLICGLLWSVLASAQFAPGQLLTAAELNGQFALYAPLAGATFTGPVTIPTLTATATTQSRLDNSTSLATDAFVNQQNSAATATVPWVTSGGTYNQATLGSGAQVVILASGGSVTSILTVAMGGSGYALGDILALAGGNSDAVLIVTGVGAGGALSAAHVEYGGTGYTTGLQLVAMSVPPGRRTVIFSGALTSNVTFIIQNGTYLNASRQVQFINNTTGSHIVTVKLSNGSGGSTGTGVVLPQGTNNSTSAIVYTDGQTDVWLANPAIPPSGSIPLSDLAAIPANTIVTNSTGSSASPTAYAMSECDNTMGALGYTPSTGIICNSSVNAGTLQGATWGAPNSIGVSTPANGNFLQLHATGEVFTGGLQVNESAAYMTLNDTSGSNSSSIYFLNNGVDEWAVANISGSNPFQLTRYVSGSPVDVPISVSNSTGLVTLADGLTVNGASTFTTTVTASSGNPNLIINDTTGSGTSTIHLNSNGTNEWTVLNAAGVGANSFQIGRYNGGTFADSPITISNSTGAVSMVDGITSSPISGSSGSFTTIAASSTITPSQTSGIVGTTTNNNANAGSVGEYISSNASSVSLTNSTATNLTSVTLTAGDWDVQCGGQFIPAGTTVFTQALLSISTTSATHTNITLGNGLFLWSGSVTGLQIAGETGVSRISVSSSTPVYCVATAGFITSTLTANTYMRARRVR